MTKGALTVLVTIRLSDLRFYALKCRDQGPYWIVPKFGAWYMGEYRPNIFSHE